MKTKYFRTWYKPYNNWINSIVLGEHGNVVSVTVSLEDSGPPTNNVRFLKEEDVDIEFSTGLEDKNGKEIYEGDIVSTIYTDQEDKKIGDIVYITEVGAYRVRCGQHLLPIVTYRVIGGSPQGLLTVASEIIGNIHENPELLK